MCEFGTARRPGKGGEAAERSEGTVDAAEHHARNRVAMAGQPSLLRGRPECHAGVELPALGRRHRDDSLGDEVQQFDALAQARQLSFLRPRRPEPSNSERRRATERHGRHLRSLIVNATGGHADKGKHSANRLRE
jgi:hypothetical protein